MGTLSTTEIAKYFANELEFKTVSFINERANKVYCASYSSGTYGRIFSKFIKDNFRTLLNLNGCSTAVALEITDLLRLKGYDFKNENSIVTFCKI